jgi:hypothetical protein
MTDLKKLGIDTCLLLFFKDQCIIIMSLQHCSPTQGEPVPSGSHSSRQRTQEFTVNRQPSTVNRHLSIMYLHPKQSQGPWQQVSRYDANIEHNIFNVTR